MSFETQAVDALHEAARGAFRTTFEAGSLFARRHSDTQKAEDLVKVLARTIDLLVACEALHDAAEAAVRDLRTALTTTMAETGATRIEATNQVANLAKKPASLTITDEAAIPRSFYVQPDPQLDKRALKSALSDGTQVPGVSLTIPNEMQLRLVAKKETPQ